MLLLSSAKYLLPSVTTMFYNASSLGYGVSLVYIRDTIHEKVPSLSSGVRACATYVNGYYHGLLHD